MLASVTGRPMNQSASDADAANVGDFDALLLQLEKLSENISVVGGYATLLAKVNSAEYRKRCGLVSH